MKRIPIYIALLACITLSSGCGRRMTQKGWYDYGNGIVNLSNVNNIQSKMSFTLVMIQTDNYGDNIEIDLVDEVAITKENIAIIKKGIKNNSGKWESVTGSCVISFDMFSLQLPFFDEYGLDCDDKGCIKLTEAWLETYSDLVDYIDPYRP